MKREALKHPQMLDIAARLGVDRARAIGIVTLGLDWTADFAIQGNIGKHSDGVIARACGWGEAPGDERIQPAEFVEHLVGAGWLDRHETARLIVHNWPTHCERWVLAKLEGTNLKFHPAYTGVVQVTKERQKYLADEPAVETVVDTAGPTAPRDLTKPILTKPILTKPKARKRAVVDLGTVKFPASLDAPEARTAALHWIEHRTRISKPIRTGESMEALLGEWATAGPAAFIAAVRHSIAQEYQGLYSPKDPPHGNRNGTGRKPYVANPGLEYVAPGEPGGSG